MAATVSPMDVPESQRLIAVSLGKIAASRGQKGGINLHKNLLVATVLSKARAAYMYQHIQAAKQRASMPPTSSSPSPPPSTGSSTCVEMKEQQQTVSESSSSSTSSSVAAPSNTRHSSTSVPAAPQSVTPPPSQPQPESPAAVVPDSAAGSSMQVVEEHEDKENTPPPSSPCRGDATSPTPSSLDCEKRLQGEAVTVDIARENKTALSSRSSVTHSQNNTTTTSRDYVNRPSTTCCLLKRRRAMDRDHENVSAPKVRIVEARVSSDNTGSSSSSPEPMQCDSPQISNLVNIFNTSFSGLSGAASGCVGQSILSAHKLSDNLTCAKEIKMGLDSVHQPLVLSV